MKSFVFWGFRYQLSGTSKAIRSVMSFAPLQSYWEMAQVRGADLHPPIYIQYNFKANAQLYGYGYGMIPGYMPRILESCGMRV